MASRATGGTWGGLSQEITLQGRRSLLQAGSQRHRALGCCSTTYVHVGAAMYSIISKSCPPHPHHIVPGKGDTLPRNQREDLETLAQPHIDQMGRLRPRGSLICSKSSYRGHPSLFLLTPPSQSVMEAWSVSECEGVLAGLPGALVQNSCGLGATPGAYPPVNLAGRVGRWVGTWAVD